MVMIDQKGRRLHRPENRWKSRSTVIQSLPDPMASAAK
jgi:hypothetical protein